MRAFLMLLGAVSLLGAAALLQAAPQQLPEPTTPPVSPAEPNPPRPPAMLEALRGRVLWLGQALTEAGLPHDADAAESAVVLRTADGALHPLVKDQRGRGFFLDPRLHALDLELVVRRTPGVPHLQVVRIYVVRPAGRFELDYWCDICSIPMYELKECECCQGEIRLRERRVSAADAPPILESGPQAAADR